MSSQHSGSAPPNAAQGYLTQLLLLSDDHALTQLIESLIAVSRQNIEAVCQSSANFSPEQSLTADLILIDRRYGGRNPHWAIEAINYSCEALGVSPSRKILLCDQQSLNQDLNQFAALARLGIDEFLLKSQLSLERLLQPAENPNTQSPIDSHYLSSESSPPFTSSHAIEIQANAPRAASTNQPAAAGFLENIASYGDGENQPESLDDHWNQHNLYLDIENQWLKIDVNQPDRLFEKNVQLPLDDWKRKLSTSSAEAIDATLEKAVNYHKLPTTVALEILEEKTGDINANPVKAELVNIRIENNGQGRVVALNASLLVASDPQQRREQVYTGDENRTVDNPSSVGASANNIARSLPLACLVLDSTGAVQSIVSDALFRSGHLPTPEVGDNLQALLGDREQVALNEEIKRCLNTGQSYSGIISYSANNGLRWFETQLTKIRGSTGLARQVIWTAFDISESRENYMELSKKEDSLSKILTNAPFLFFEKDHNGHYRRANQAFCNLLAVEESAIIGRRDKDLFADELCAYLQSLEQFIRQDQDDETVFEEPIPANMQENFGSIYWRSRAMKYRFGEGVESLLAFGISVNHMAKESHQPPKIGDVTDIKLKLETSSVEENSNPNFQVSGSLKQDFKAMLASLVNYTEMAVSQKNELRNQKLIEQLDSLEATAARAKTLIASNNLHNTDGDNQFSLNACNLQQLTEQIVDMQRPTLPTSLDFKTNLLCMGESALVRAEDYQKIVLQLISSARDTAIKRQSSVATSNNSVQGVPAETQHSAIELTLLPVSANTICSACGEPIVGDFLELAVHTNEFGFSSDDLKALIKQAKIAVQRSAESAGQTNVMALTHQQQGHALIEHSNGRLSLKLLFKKEFL